MSAWTWVVIVGANSPDEAVPEHADCCGINVYGTYTADEAERFIADVQAVWLKVAQEHPEFFVFGTPTATMHRLLGPSEAPGFLFLPDAERAARNWYMDPEGVTT